MAPEDRRQGAPAHRWIDHVQWGQQSGCKVSVPQQLEAQHQPGTKGGRWPLHVSSVHSSAQSAAH